MDTAAAIVWSLRADATAPARARALVDRAPLDRLDHALRDTLALLLSEIVTNSVRHAGLTGEDQIECTIAPGDPIHVEVRDPGAGFRAKPVAARPDGRGGWGLVLLDRLATRWGVQGARPACVWFDLAQTGSPVTGIEHTD